MLTIPTTTRRTTRPFRPEHTEARIRELRRIAQPIVQAYQSDLEHDERALREQPHVETWLWVPYPSGSHIAPLTPKGKNWAEAITDHCNRAYEATPTPHLITPQAIRSATWAQVRVRLQELEDATYTVTGSKGEILIVTSDWHLALREFEYHRGSATLREANEPTPLLERDGLPEHLVAAVA